MVKVTVKDGVPYMPVYLLHNKAETKGVVALGMMHIASPTFYDNATKLLKDCDIILREGILPVEDYSQVDKDKLPYVGIMDNLSRTYSMMARYMGLVTQSPYMKADARWVKADISLDALLNACPSRLLDSLNMDMDAYSDFERALQYQKQATANFHRQIVAFSIANPLAIKLLGVLTKGLGEAIKSNAVGTLFNGLILDDRNEHLFTVIDRSMDYGEKMIGIPWGAAHMPGIVSYLRERHGMELFYSSEIPIWEKPAEAFLQSVEKIGPYLPKKKK